MSAVSRTSDTKLHAVGQYLKDRPLLGLARRTWHASVASVRKCNSEKEGAELAKQIACLGHFVTSLKKVQIWVLRPL